MMVVIGRYIDSSVWLALFILCWRKKASLLGSHQTAVPFTCHVANREAESSRRTQFEAPDQNTIENIRNVLSLLFPAPRSDERMLLLTNLPHPV